MASRTAIANRALGHFGQYRITDIDENDPAAEAVRDAWDITRDAALGAFHWNFATKAARLSKLAAAPQGWAYQWPLPADFRRMVRVNGELSGTRDTEFTIRGNVLLTQGDQAEIEYVGTVAECELWDAEFVDYFALRLGAAIAPRLTLNTSTAERLAGMAAQAGMAAAGSDAVNARPMVRMAEEGSAYQRAIHGQHPLIG